MAIKLTLGATLIVMAVAIAAGLSAIILAATT